VIQSTNGPQALVDSLSRVERALDALADDDLEIAFQILDDLAADLRAEDERKRA
jgi:hypothetical protein